jgi:glycosyltransferase involved in cell wall biosynthesis
VSSGHDVADARLHRLVEAFTRAGLTTEVLALGPAWDAPPGSRFRSLGRSRSPGRRVLQAVRGPLVARGRALVVLDPDTLPAALLMRHLGDRALVADVHEDYVALVSDRPWPAWRRAAGVAVARMGQVCARHADIVAVADEHVPPFGGRERVVVRNLPDLSTLSAQQERDPAPRAAYVGDLRTSRGLRRMLAAVEQAPGWTLDLVGPPAPADADWLEDWRRRSPAAARVRLHGRQPPRRSWEIVAGAWVGLALLDDTPAFRAAVPSKVYEYAAAGLALLATPLPRVAAIVEEADAGALVRDEAEASATLRAWQAAPEVLDRHRAAARAWAARSLMGPSPFDRLARRVQSLVEDRRRQA